MGCIRKLLDERKREDRSAVDAEIGAGFKDGCMRLVEGWRDCPPGCFIAINSAGNIPTLLIEVGGGILQRGWCRFARVSFRCRADLQFSHDEIAIHRSAWPTGR